jgi:hypothetical protein
LLNNLREVSIMNARQLLRIAAFAAALEMGGFALADVAADNGGGTAAPQPGQPPARSGGGGQPGQPPSTPSPGTPAAGHQPGQAPAAQPPAKAPRQTPSADRTPIYHPPRTAAESEREHQARTAREEAARQPKPPVDGSVSVQRGRRIYPRAMYGWAPYSWWFSGNSYWWPPMEDYGNPYDYDNQNRRPYDEGTASTLPPETPATPPDTSPPTLEQAKALNQLEASPDYRLALADLKLAQHDYDSARDRVLEKLKKNPEYQALVEKRDHAAEHVEAVQAAARIPNPESVTPAAQRKLDINAKVTRMEQAALDADPSAHAAEETLVKAKARVAAMRQGVRSDAAR